MDEERQVIFGNRRSRLVRSESRDLCEVNREPCLNHKLIINQIIFRVSKRVDKCEVTRGAEKAQPSTEQRLSERHLPTFTGGRLLPTPPQQPSGITQCGALLMRPNQIQEAASQTCWDQSETKSSGELAFRDVTLAGLGHSATQGSHTEEGANVPHAP